MSNFYMGPGDEDAIETMTSAKLREIDKTLRADLTGHSVEEIELGVHAAYDSFDIKIADRDFFTPYSQSIADGKEWIFEKGEAS